MEKKYKVVEDNKEVVKIKNEIFEELSELFGAGFEYRSLEENKSIWNFTTEKVIKLQKLVDELHLKNKKRR